MSGLLAGKVWQSALEPHLKPLAAALADIANDDGTKIYPSVAYMAWLLGRSPRQIQAGLSELRNLKVLKVVTSTSGGRGHTTEYRLIETKLPSRPPWKDRQPSESESDSKDATPAPFSETDVKGAGFARKGEVSDKERVKQASPDPSSGSVRDPLVDPPHDPTRAEARDVVGGQEEAIRESLRREVRVNYDTYLSGAEMEICGSELKIYAPHFADHVRRFLGPSISNIAARHGLERVEILTRSST